MMSNSLERPSSVLLPMRVIVAADAELDAPETDREEDVDPAPEVAVAIVGQEQEVRVDCSSEHCEDLAWVQTLRHEQSRTSCEDQPRVRDEDSHHPRGRLLLAQAHRLNGVEL